MYVLKNSDKFREKKGLFVLFDLVFYNSSKNLRR